MKTTKLLIFLILICLTTTSCGLIPGDSPDTSSAGGSDISDNHNNISHESGSDNSSESASESEPEESKAEYIEKKFSQVPVFLLGDDRLESLGLYVESSAPLTIDVTLVGTKEAMASIKVLDIEATADVSEGKKAGKAEFDIVVNAPDGVSVLTVSHQKAVVDIKKGTSTDPDDSKPKPDDSDDSSQPSSGKEAYISNGIIIDGTRAMEQFGGTKVSGENTAAKLNEFKAAVGDVNVYILAAPNASAFYAPAKYPKSIANHKSCLEGMRDKLVNVGYVDTLAALAPHVDEYIYSRTDHHWQALGAYYCAEAFAELAGLPFADLSTFTKESFDGFVGTMYKYSQDPVIKNNPETFTWYVPSTEYTLNYYSRDYFKNPKSGSLFASSKSYSKFINGDSYTTHITTNVGTGRKLLLFKDSYGNALAPFLISSFDEVIIADYRYFKLNAKSFIDTMGITDVCFEFSAFALAGTSRNYITSLIRQK